MTVSIRFHSDLPHQKAAVESVVDLFAGQPHAAGTFESRLGGPRRALFDELGIGNGLALSEPQLLENLRAVQARQALPVSDALAGPHFSIEMETGTGKTYVYLQTAHTLAARYGFKKFVVVVPSVAIREGVLKTIGLTRAHFDGRFGPAWGHAVYGADRLGDLRQFAASNRLELLVVNIDAFNKASNVMNREQDALSGRRPIELLRATRPIVILDEPQNMESDKARAAIESLHPTCTLRYSATHRSVYNLVHRLDPVAAYDQRLVKRIEVAAVVDAEDRSKPFVEVEDITATSTKVTARLRVDVEGNAGVKRARKSVSKQGDDLFDLTGREAYKGWVVDVIDRAAGHVRFTNGVCVARGQRVGGYGEDVMRLQVRETVLAHLEKELRVQRLAPERRLKVLSLFFIDRVASYAPADGRIRRWFVEAYEELSARPEYAPLGLPPASEVQGAYFASSREKGQIVLKDTSGATAADDEAYALIMRDKERLLSLETPLRFIFSHSALREGWDNPNVFQICTLNETRSDLKKRQEIGRGLRLPVDVSGERAGDEDVAVLTVITNERYETFAAELQREIREETGVDFTGRIVDRGDRRRVALRPGFRDDPSFRLLFDAVSPKTRYEVRVDRARLVADAVALLAATPPIAAPEIVVQRRALAVDRAGVHTTMLQADRREAVSTESPVPDLLGYLQAKTPLTRATLAEVLERSGRLADAIENPQVFLDRARDVLQRALRDQLVQGLAYVTTGQRWTVAELFEHGGQGGFEGYRHALVPVTKSTHEAVVVQSEVERAFARHLEGRRDVAFFVKLPGRFTVPTPLGTYNPDWAVVVRSGDAARVVVVETKGTKDALKLRPDEWGKVQCGMRHFAALGVAFALKHGAEAL